jgi:hypothetical protein
MKKGREPVEKNEGIMFFFHPFFCPPPKRLTPPVHLTRHEEWSPLSQLLYLFRELGVKVGRGEGPCVFRMMNTITAIQVLVHSVCSVCT